jgi:hypothetical protein
MAGMNCLIYTNTCNYNEAKTMLQENDGQRMKEYINYPFGETSVNTTRKKNHSETKNQLSTHEEKI